MGAAQPWMKFYPRDWRADEKLRDCSLAARGLWIEMLSIMHASERYGRLLIAGSAPNAGRLAKQVGGTEGEVETLLAELETAQVFSRDATGVIYSRRMKSDEKSAENARKVGKRGGNPNLLKQTRNPTQDNPPDNHPVNQRDKGGDKPRGQRPEKKASPKKTMALPDDWKPEPFGEGAEAGEIMAAWPDGEEKRQIERFRDHHRAKGNRYADWQAAWGTWVRNSLVFARRKGANGASQQRNFEDIVAEEYELREAAVGAAR